MERFDFRVWNKEENEYIDGVLCIGGNGKEIMDVSRLQCYDYKLENYIIEQCTGLKDKNGKLIYEGDIVIEGGCKGVVKYGTFNCSCCDGVYGWYFDGFNGQTDIRCYEFCEVIGNIHEQKDNK